MNTVNASTGFSGFQLGCSPRVIPPIVPKHLPIELQDAALTAMLVIQQLEDDVAQARDNLLLAKITQSHHANTNHVLDPGFNINDLVMLSTANRRHKYKKRAKNELRSFSRDGTALIMLLVVILKHPHTHWISQQINSPPTMHPSSNHIM